jgi:hypothetical protein
MARKHIDEMNGIDQLARESDLETLFARFAEKT